MVHLHQRRSMRFLLHLHNITECNNHVELASAKVLLVGRFGVIVRRYVRRVAERDRVQLVVRDIFELLNKFRVH